MTAFNSSGFIPVLTSTFTPGALPRISATSGAIASLTSTRFITFSKTFSKLKALHLFSEHFFQFGKRHFEIGFFNGRTAPETVTGGRILVRVDVMSDVFLAQIRSDAL